VGSAAQRDFPSAFIQFLYCVGVQPHILPPRHPELNCYVERYHKTYKQECLQVFRPSTLEEVRTVTKRFEHHYNTERPNPRRSCRNQPPAQAHPILPQRPSLPKTVDPDRWLMAMDGRWYPRRVRADGRIQIDGRYYYVKQTLAGHQILVRLNASARCGSRFSSRYARQGTADQGVAGRASPPGRLY
jgi:integrase-like protein